MIEDELTGWPGERQQLEGHAETEPDLTCDESNAFTLDPESFDELLALLDAPPVIPDGLRNLMARRPMWEPHEDGEHLGSPPHEV